jgi:hypothetical protein
MGSSSSKISPAENISPTDNKVEYSVEYSIECKKNITPEEYLKDKIGNIIKDLIDYKYAHEGQTYILKYHYGYNIFDIFNKCIQKYDNKIYEIEYADKNKYNQVLRVLYIDAMSSEFKSRSDGILNYVQQKLFPHETSLSSPHINLIELLKSHFIFLLVIIDNMEEIYRENSLHIDENYREIYDLKQLGSSERIALIGCSSSSLLSSLASNKAYSVLRDNLKKEFLDKCNQIKEYINLPELHKYINYMRIPGFPFMELKHNIVNLDSDQTLKSHIKSFCLDYPETKIILKLLYDAMYELNIDLFTPIKKTIDITDTINQIYRKNKLYESIDNILTEPIINRIKQLFVPLNYDHICAIMFKALNKELADYMDMYVGSVEKIINFIEFDVGLIVTVNPYEYNLYKYDVDPNLIKVYPNSIKNLMFHILTNEL